MLSTPLVAAILARQEAIALYLLEQGTNPALFSEFDGLTPLQAARPSGLPAVEQRLRALGASDPAGPVAGRWWKRLQRRGG